MFLALERTLPPNVERPDLRLTTTEATDATWRERNTAVDARIVHGVYNPNAAGVRNTLDDASTAPAVGQREVAFHALTRLQRPRLLRRDQ